MLEVYSDESKWCQQAPVRTKEGRELRSSLAFKDTNAYSFDFSMCVLRACYELGYANTSKEYGWVVSEYTKILERPSDWNDNWCFSFATLIETITILLRSNLYLIDHYND